MNKPEGFYTTRMLVEVTVHTQLGPRTAIDLVRMSLKMPAISVVDVLGAASDYNEDDPHNSKPIGKPKYRVLKGLGK